MIANELRIGNLVGIASSLNFRIGKVTLISNSRILLDNKISNKNHKFIPIKLTEEWLFKFGFFAKNINCNFIREEIEISSSSRIIQTNERGGFYLDGEIPDFMKIRISYVHQLQNLYFAITGEDLILNEKL